VIWNREAETMPREQLQALQLERLQRSVDRQLASVQPRADALHAAGVTSGQDVRKLDDLHPCERSHRDSPSFPPMSLNAG